MGLTILPPAFCQLTERNETEQQGKNSLPPHCLSVFHFATDWLKKKKRKVTNWQQSTDHYLENTGLESF